MDSSAICLLLSKLMAKGQGLKVPPYASCRQPYLTA
jgi:hypothetical protein